MISHCIWLTNNIWHMPSIKLLYLMACLRVQILKCTHFTFLKCMKNMGVALYGLLGDSCLTQQIYILMIYYLIAICITYSYQVPVIFDTLFLVLIKTLNYSCCSQPASKWTPWGRGICNVVSSQYQWLHVTRGKIGCLYWDKIHTIHCNGHLCTLLIWLIAFI